jgi:hypothetical protein
VPPIFLFTEKFKEARRSVPAVPTAIYINERELKFDVSTSNEQYERILNISLLIKVFSY